MSYTTENTIDKRRARVSAAINLKEGDRVPFTPKTGVAVAQSGNIDLYEAYMDYRNMKSGVINFLTRYESDLFWLPAAYPANVMEVLGTTAVKWPGATRDIPLNSGHQIVDRVYMEQDEYDEFLVDPTAFYINKVFPRKHAKLQGLTKMTSFSNILELGHFANMAAFSDPDVRQALLTLMFAGEESAKWQAASRELCQTALDMQCPLGCVIGQTAPYDMLADNLRGFLEVPMDLAEVPDKVLAAIDVMTHYAIKGVNGIKAAGMDYVFIPLHGGTDDFMSDETYRKYYWPSLRIMLDEIIRLGMTPYLFCEGKYNSRLEILRDVPKGKVIYLFEQVDLPKAKKVLGDVACIGGNMPTASLVYGKKEDIIEETKRMLDACAPGGGFLMDCSIVVDHYNEENFDAWYETTLKYGKY